MERMRNLSVRKTIFLYMTVALFCSFFLSAAIVRIASRAQLRIWWNYADQEAYFRAVEQEGVGKDIARPGAFEMTRRDLFWSELCDFLQTYTILILSMAGSCAAVFLFYRNKLQKPVKELALASKRIGENDLDFHITYQSGDEMGALCVEFERMREQLAENNRILWKSIEEEKLLRAAIAHDIRAPLSILKGYLEMLTEYLSNAEIDAEGAMEMLSESESQVERMDTFVETMRKMSSLENRKLVGRKISAKRLEADIRAELAALEKEYGKASVLQGAAPEKLFFGDREVILEVIENLLSNAFRYGKHQVEIRIRVEEAELTVSVRDDGDGFLENAETVMEAFRQQNMKDSLKHAGIGMYLCRLYCEKHGGKLILENDKQKGAVATATFHRIA